MGKRNPEFSGGGGDLQAATFFPLTGCSMSYTQCASQQLACLVPLTVLPNRLPTLIRTFVHCLCLQPALLGPTLH